MSVREIRILVVFVAFAFFLAGMVIGLDIGGAL